MISKSNFSHPHKCIEEQEGVESIKISQEGIHDVFIAESHV